MMSSRVAIVLLVLGGASLTHAASATDRSAVLARCEAEIYFYEGRLAADPSAFLHAVSLGQAYTAKARLTGALADYKSAEKAYRRSLAITPAGNVAGSVGLASALQSQHRFREAQVLIDEARAEAPQIPRVSAVAGDIAFELGDYNLADSLYRKFADRDPGLESWSRLAKIALLHGRWDSTRILWERVCGLPVDASNSEPSAWAWVMHGELYLRAGRLADARKRFEQSLQVMPGYFLGLEHLAETYELENNGEKAEPILRSAIAQVRHADLLMRLAKLRDKNGDSTYASSLRDSAVAMLEAELKVGDAGHRRVLITALLDRGGNPARALELAQQEVSDRGDIGAEMVLAKALAANGRYKEAADHAHQALRFGSYEPKMFADASDILRQAGYTQRADSLSAVAARFNPRFATTSK